MYLYILLFSLLLASHGAPQSNRARVYAVCTSKWSPDHTLTAHSLSNLSPASLNLPHTHRHHASLPDESCVYVDLSRCWLQHPPLPCSPTFSFDTLVCEREREKARSLRDQLVASCRQGGIPLVATLTRPSCQRRVPLNARLRTRAQVEDFRPWRRSRRPQAAGKMRRA